MFLQVNKGIFFVTTTTTTTEASADIFKIKMAWRTIWIYNVQPQYSSSEVSELQRLHIFLKHGQLASWRFNAWNKTLCTISPSDSNEEKYENIAEVFYKGCFRLHKSGMLTGCYMRICSWKATGHTNVPDTFYPHQNAQELLKMLMTEEGWFWHQTFKIWHSNFASFSSWKMTFCIFFISLLQVQAHTC